MRTEPTLGDRIAQAIMKLRTRGETIDPGHWQGIETESHPEMVTREIINVQFSAQIPPTEAELQWACIANQPWAEQEFEERVGGEPHNPHHSMKNWPWWHGQIDEEMTHTYSERFWAKSAVKRVGTKVIPFRPLGIRYGYGDLTDVVNLLAKHPHTRQATFPIFFPEDTGAVHGGRIPCTLHYHFLLRNDQLHLWYPIRSCDAVRHFRDDVYMAGRLCQWVIEQLTPLDPWVCVKPGMLHFTAYSFHVHKADEHLL